MTWDEMHTALTEIDEAFEAGEMALSRAELSALDTIAWLLQESDDWTPAHWEQCLLEDLLARSVPSLGKMHARLPV